VRAEVDSRRPERRRVTSFEGQLVIAVTHRTFTNVPRSRDTRAMWSNKRANVYPKNPEASWHSGRVYVDYCNAVWQPWQVWQTHSTSDTAPIAPISSTGTAQPLTVQHCHRTRPIRNSACSGPYSSVAGGLPSPPSTLSESFRSTRNGCQAESVPGWRKLALEHTHTLQHLTQQRNTRQSV
jgi:hypothetical protein